MERAGDRGQVTSKCELTEKKIWRQIWRQILHETPHNMEPGGGFMPYLPLYFLAIFGETDRNMEGKYGTSWL